MPVYLRNFYYQKLVKTKEDEKKEIEKSQKKQSPVSQPFINPRFKQ